MKKSNLERRFRTLARLVGLPEYVSEYRFAADHVGMGDGLRQRLVADHLRDWRFDCAWVKDKLAVELDGGVYTRGRHVRGAGFESDCEKLNAAVLLGWRVLRFTPRMLDDPRSLEIVKEALGVSDVS